MNNLHLTTEYIISRLYSICDDMYYYSRNYLVSYQMNDVKNIIDLISALKSNDTNSIRNIYNAYQYALSTRLTQDEMNYIRDLFDLKVFL